MPSYVRPGIRKCAKNRALSAMMHCRMVMLPTLIVLGVLTIVFAAIAIWLDSRAAKRN